MASSGYVADTFVAGEQPTTSKWNELWSNDASFNSGNGFNDGIVIPRHISTNAVQAQHLDTGAITLGYAQITTGFGGSAGSTVQVTGLTVSVTIPAGGRRVKITAFSYDLSNNTGGNGVSISIWDGTVGTGTKLNQLDVTSSSSGFGWGGTCIAVVSPSAGGKTYNVGVATGTGIGAVGATSNSPAFILVEAI